MLKWQEVFSKNGLPWQDAETLAEPLSCSTLAQLKSFLDAVHIRFCLVKPFQETKGYPLVESRELLPSFDNDMFEHKDLPGFAMVAFARQLHYFSEIFQYDKLHPVITEVEGVPCCPLESQVYHQNLETLASRLPRLHQDVFRQQFRTADTSLLDTYPALVPYLCSMDRAQAFAARHGIPQCFSSLEEMAASPGVDAVYIATPNFRHADQSILCMDHGKHVLCEKPLSTCAAEAEKMIATARRRGVVLMEAMKSTLNPNFSALKAAVGRIGAVRRYFASYCQYSSRYDRYKAGELPNAFNPAYAGGALMDIGVYTVYPMVALFGMPRTVRASALLLPSGADGQGSATFGYDGMEATIIYSKIADSSLPSEIQGEDGTVVVDHINNIGRISLIERPAGSAGGRRRESAAVDLSVPADKDEYYYEAAEFADLILHGKPESAVNSHSNSLHTMELLDEIRRQTGIVFSTD